MFENTGSARRYRRRTAARSVGSPSPSRQTSNDATRDSQTEHPQNLLRLVLPSCRLFSRHYDVLAHILLHNQNASKQRNGECQLCKQNAGGSLNCPRIQPSATRRRCVLPGNKVPPQNATTVRYAKGMG